MLEEKGKRRRQARAEQKIAYILEATAQLLSERGPEAITTNHVAERAGVSVGTLYRYFQNKDDLKQQLFIFEVRKKIKEAEQVTRDKSITDANEFADRIIDVFMGFFEGRMHIKKILEEEIQKSREILELIDRERIEIIEKIEARLTEIEPSRFRDLNEEERKLLLVSWRSVINSAVEGELSDLQRENLRRIVSGMAVSYLSR